MKALAIEAGDVAFRVADKDKAFRVRRFALPTVILFRPNDQVVMLQGFTARVAAVGVDLDPCELGILDMVLHTRLGLLFSLVATADDSYGQGHQK